LPQATLLRFLCNIWAILDDINSFFLWNTYWENGKNSRQIQGLI
jgi:hypothetical protein